MGNEKNYTQEKRAMHRISSYAGRPEYVQGGGGNTSVKFDDSLMAIKASGYTLGEITGDKGYVTVDYPKIRRYYDSVDKDAGRDYEKESLEVNLSSIVLLPGMEEKRPSVEVGFHSFLSRNVIHTHSVYANVLCCSEEGAGAAQDIFSGSGIGVLFLPSIDPGFTLTLFIKESLDAYGKENGRAPDALFLNNHGLIVQGEDADAAINIHETVNEKIKKHFGLKDFACPAVSSILTASTVWFTKVFS
jgi:rhamnose utilization protein RhaD (predicted bifunctional aldolase and dehydrogenase)